jgi:putative FmdB family regulatory protein
LPTYQYACTACDHAFEAVQKFTDDALTECPACAGRLRKVFSAVGVVFKGSGFYRTDSRSKSSSSEAPATSQSSGESKPAKTESAKKSTAESAA